MLWRYSGVLWGTLRCVRWRAHLGQRELLKLVHRGDGLGQCVERIFIQREHLSTPSTPEYARVRPSMPEYPEYA